MMSLNGQHSHSAGLQLRTRSILEPILSIRPSKVNVQESSGTSPIGEPTRETNHDVTKRKTLATGR